MIEDYPRGHSLSFPGTAFNDKLNGAYLLSVSYLYGDHNVSPITKPTSKTWPLQGSIRNKLKFADDVVIPYKGGLELENTLPSKLQGKTNLQSVESSKFLKMKISFKVYSN